MLKKRNLIPADATYIFFQRFEPNITKTSTFLSRQCLDAEARAIAAALAEKENPEKAEITEAAPEE